MLSTSLLDYRTKSADQRLIELVHFYHGHNNEKYMDSIKKSIIITIRYLNSGFLMICHGYLLGDKTNEGIWIIDIDN